MSSNEMNHLWPHNDEHTVENSNHQQQYKSKNNTDLTKYNNQFIVQCKKCQSPCLLRDKSPPTWKCDNCNIIYSNIYNNIQQQKQSITLHNSVSTSTESDIHCVLIGQESNTNTMDIKQSSNDTSYRRNISRSITLNICDIDSTSTATETTFINSQFHTNKKLEFKNNESEDSEYILYQYFQRMHANANANANTNNNALKPQLTLQNWTTNTTCTQDSTIANKSNSPNAKIINTPNRNIKITRRKSYDYKRKTAPKIHKKFNSTWSPSLKILSETPELYNSNNNPENPFCKRDSIELLLRADQSVSSHMVDSVEEAYGEYINAEYCNQINDEFYVNNDNGYGNNDNGYNNYMHIVQAQQALQAAYLKGFTQGYSTGVQFQVSGMQCSSMSMN